MGNLDKRLKAIEAAIVPASIYDGMAPAEISARLAKLMRTRTPATVDAGELYELATRDAAAANSWAWLVGDGSDIAQPWRDAYMDELMRRAPAGTDARIAAAWGSVSQYAAV